LFNIAAQKAASPGFSCRRSCRAF